MFKVIEVFMTCCGFLVSLKVLKRDNGYRQVIYLKHIAPGITFIEIYARSPGNQQ